MTATILAIAAGGASGSLPAALSNVVGVGALALGLKLAVRG